MNIHEIARYMRKNYCDSCQEQYTDQEIEDGEMCEGCRENKKAGERVANLPD